MKKFLCLFTAVLFCTAGFSQNKAAMLKNYLEVKDALVNSDSKTAMNAINTFYQDMKNDPDFKGKTPLLNATEKLNASGDLEKQREAFMEVSVSFWNIMKSGEKGNTQVYYQYCPMKKAYWLSTEKAIKNPYYGSAMLTCGKVTEKLKD